ncbi:hypothetical protein [Niveibacterium terrae]|uniref:hypothetical protein n=1 Tax=Niveibacterium terrae TaxID=3373598 RepID=UPI003A945A10
MRIIDTIRLKYDNEKRKRNRIIATASLAIAVSIVFFYFFVDAPNLSIQTNISKEGFFAISIGLLAVLMSFIVMNYLQAGSTKNEPPGSPYSTQEYELKYLQSEFRKFYSKTNSNIDSLTSNLEKISSDLTEIQRNNSGIDETSRATVVDVLLKKIQESAATTLVQGIQREVEIAITEANQHSDIYTQFENARLRLLQEISSLGRRGNLNLTIGVTTTVVGLFLLGYFVLLSEIQADQPIYFVVHFLPRLTLVIFIEVFAYFFLGLYKRNLQEIKYFQNETTNIEAKFIATKAALNASEQKTISDIINILGNTERNHVLESGQTTVEIEKARMDQEGLGELAKRISSLLSNKS